MCDLEIHKVSGNLNGQLIIGQCCVYDTNIVKIAEISSLPMFALTK